MDDKTRDEDWEKAWEEASDFERRRYAAPSTGKGASAC
jgi:hypothetical protein